jgi:hypothetical protein
MADDQPTCGKGLAANAILPERLAALMNAMATMLENHTRALDPTETSGRLERDAYERLVRDQRALASGLEACARAMEGNRDLPMARHNMALLNDQASRAVLAAFIEAERDLITLLQKQAESYAVMLAQMTE